MRLRPSLRCFPAPVCSAARFFRLFLLALAVFSPCEAVAAADAKTVFVDNGKPILVREEGKAWKRGDGHIECQGVNNLLIAGQAVGEGDSHVRVELTLFDLANSAASFAINERSHFGFEGSAGEIFVQGPFFGGPTKTLGQNTDMVKDGRRFTFEVVRKGDEVSFRIDGKERYKTPCTKGRFGSIALRPWRSRMRVHHFSVVGQTLPLPPKRTQPTTYSIPILDLSRETKRQVIIESIPGQYLGHPTTVLLADNKTILVTYPLGHGGPAAVLKKSTDGGLTWSGRLPVPDNWKTATNCPCIHRLTGPGGIERLFVFEGNGAMRQSVSLDNGKTWTPFKPNGLHCVVAPITIVEIAGNRHLALYHRGHSDQDHSPLTIWQSISADGGLTWGPERKVAEFEGADPCEPAVIRSPDGKQLACLMRENRRRYNSLLMVSNDEGQTWSKPVELPASLTGDRHLPRYTHDGRLVIPFRDTAAGSPTRGDFVAWVGTYDDVVNLREGQYRVRLLDSPKKFDLGYPGLEVLPDGTLVVTTYAVLKPGEKNSVVSVRFTMKELDAKAAGLPKQAAVFVSGKGGYHTYRIPALAVSKKGTILAFCEGRKKSRSDHGDIDLLLRRSFDNGKTWGPTQKIHDDGKNTIGNPCPVVDETTGIIWLLFCRNNDRVFVTKSTDDGATWAEPTEITSHVKDSSWTWYATGPGHGIQLRSGRLLIPCDHRVKGKGRTMFSHVFYSDDHGKTWRRGGSLADRTDECMAVQTAGGTVYLNMRSYHKKNRRAVAWSGDGGETWSATTLDQTLIEPVCQASLIRLTDAQRGDKNRVLFANPAATKREKMTIRISYDECRTWSAGKVLHRGPSAYSDLVVAKDMTIGCLYEGGQKSPYETITFARFGLDWLTDGKDSLPPPADR